MIERKKRGPRGAPLVHGWYGNYSNKKCKCSDCTNAWRIYVNEKRKQRRDFGLCRECTKPAEEGRAFCKKCLERRNKNYHYHKERQR